MSDVHHAAIDAMARIAGNVSAATSTTGPRPGRGQLVMEQIGLGEPGYVAPIFPADASDPERPPLTQAAFVLATDRRKVDKTLNGTPALMPRGAYDGSIIAEAKRPARR
jgi:hypothetical protein